LFEKSAPIIGRLATELEGTDGFRLWHDQALYKEPWANATAWHIDVPFWSFSSPHAISIWIALDDATKENGCMYFLQGSHKPLREEFDKTGTFKEIKIGKNMNDLFTCMPQFSSGYDPIPVEMKAGSCSFHSGMLSHGAGANMTPNRRRAMTMALMPLHSKFNGTQNILTKEQLQTLKVGDLLEFEGNPIMYSKNKK